MDPIPALLSQLPSGDKKKRRFYKNGLLILKFRLKVLFTKNRYKLQHFLTKTCFSTQAIFRTSRCHSNFERKTFFLTFSFCFNNNCLFCKLSLKVEKFLCFYKRFLSRILAFRFNISWFNCSTIDAVSISKNAFTKRELLLTFFPASLSKTT